MTDSTPYYSRPHAERMALHHKICALGNGSPSPSGEGHIVIPIARDQLGPTNLLMADHGFRMVDVCYFPLGTDTPPAELRHDGRIGNQVFPSSNWMYARYGVAANSKSAA